jgi:acyl dehydratase
MAVSPDDLIGKPTGASTIHVERGQVSRFAEAVKDKSDVYQSPEAARAAGFDTIPAPPTFTFAAAHWGTFPEDQPEDPNAGKSNPMRDVMGSLMSQGGLMLHGEQEFIYHKPVQVGDTLHHEGRISDFYTKEAKGKTMTFLVMENVFKDDSGEPVVTERFNLIHRK